MLNLAATSKFPPPPHQALPPKSEPAPNIVVSKKDAVEPCSQHQPPLTMLRRTCANLQYVQVLVAASPSVDSMHKDESSIAHIAPIQEHDRVKDGADHEEQSSPLCIVLLDICAILLSSIDSDGWKKGAIILIS